MLGLHLRQVRQCLNRPDPNGHFTAFQHFGAGRVVGNHRLTFESLNMSVCEIGLGQCRDGRGESGYCSYESPYTRATGVRLSGHGDSLVGLIVRADLRLGLGHDLSIVVG